MEVKGLKKLVILSTGAVIVICTSLVMMKLGGVFPYDDVIIFSSVVKLWNSIRCLLSSSLYICIIINSMVLLIAATSAFQPSHETTDDCTNYDLVYDDDDDKEHILIATSSPPPPPLPPPLPDVTEVAPPETAVAREHEEYDTMEATWKAIVTKRPIRKQLRKSDTWQAHAPPLGIDSEPLIPSSSSSKELRKSETFNESVSIRRGLVRDPSVGLDELNRQVEAFIQKFNDDMKLQRQESDQRFLDMMKRGL